MVSYLTAQARPAQKQARLLEQREELQRELTESLLGNWLTAADPHAAQQRGQQLLRALQAQAGRHGELLERLLPQRDTLRQLYQQQQHATPAPTTTPVPFGLDIDLFGAPETPAPGEPSASPFAARVFADWINHLRSLPDSRRLLELLGVEKPHLELLVDALIGAACRLRLDDELERALCAGACRNRVKIGKSARRWRYWATSSPGSASSGAMRQRAPRAASTPASRSLPRRRSRRWTGAASSG